MQPFHDTTHDPRSSTSRRTVHAMFHQVAAAMPDNTALAFEGGTVSYAQLRADVDALSRQLRTIDSPIVGVCMARSPEWVVAVLAALSAGRAYVSLDVDASADRQLAQLRACGSRVVLTSPAREVDLGSFETHGTVIEVGLEAALGADDPMPPIGEPDSELAAVIFTSGTSEGLPKGVQLTHTNLASYFDEFRVEYECAPEDRMLWITSVVWDANLFPVFGALTRGATLVVTPQPKGGVLDLGSLPALMRRERITYAMMPTAVFHVVAGADPGAFEHCHALWVGGEALSWSHTQRVLDHVEGLTVFNNYGPTEATISCTSWSITANQFGQLDQTPTATVPIGSHNANVGTLVLHADTDEPVVEIGGVGELVLTGAGVSPGYLDAPELTARHFLTLRLPGQPPTWAHRSGDFVRIIGTDDAGEHVYEFLGRLDKQVKYRGFRIDLAAIECVLERHREVARAVLRCVRAKGRDQHHLVAYVVPQAKVQTADLPARLRDWIVDSMPRYMVPSAFTLLEQLPLATNGKVDDRALPPPRLERELVSGGSVPDYCAAETPDQARLQSLWIDVLELDRVGVDDSFEAVGGDSLNAVRLVAEINRACFDADTARHQLLTAADLYEHPTIRSLAERLAERREIARGTREHTTRLGRFVLQSSDADLDLLAEAKLCPSVRPQGSRTPASSLTPKRGILLTGATGYLGAHLLVELAARFPELEIFVLVRAPTPEQAKQRVRATLDRFELGARASSTFTRATFICGSFERPALGLDDALLRRLREDVDLIVHNGAKVNYCQPFSMLRAANVGGTETLLRLCCEGRPKGMLYVSTASVCGPRGLFGDQTTTVFEDDHEALLESGRTHLRFSMGYVRSKWVAEQLVWEAGRRGVPVAVARPGFILGDCETGVGNPQDFIYRFVSDVVRMGSYPMMRCCREEFVPIDIVRESILRMIESPDSLGRAYHLVPRIEDEFVTVDFGDQIQEFCGVELRGLAYADWVGKVREFIARCRRGEHGRGGRSGRSLSEGIARLEPIAGYLERSVAIDTQRNVPLTSWEAWNCKMPIFDTGNSDALLRSSGLSCPPPRDVALANLRYMRRRGIV